MAGGSRARLLVISATISIRPRGAWATLPKQAIMPTTMKEAGTPGMPGATVCTSRQRPSPRKPPMTMPGPKMPPEPPDPIDSEVVRIFTSGRASTTQMALAARARRCPGAGRITLWQGRQFVSTAGLRARLSGHSVASHYRASGRGWRRT
jgi:hypothetical protein